MKLRCVNCNEVVSIDDLETATDEYGKDYACCPKCHYKGERGEKVFTIENKREEQCEK